MTSKAFLDATVVRRSIVQLKNQSPIPDERIVEIVQHAILHSPSPFHVQSCRAIVLFKKEHEKLWDIARETLEQTIPAAQMAIFDPKLRDYRGAYGTVMFFEDAQAPKLLPPFMSAIGAKFPEWYEHSNGMNQYIVWTALSVEGLGCNLQHYQPGISARVAAEWNVPLEWTLRAQLVFGEPYGSPRGGEKTFKPLEERVKVFGQ